MTDPAGDTAAVLREAGINTIVPLDSKEEISQGLGDFLYQVRQGITPIPNDNEIHRHSREVRSQGLARLLDSLSGGQINMRGTK